MNKTQILETIKMLDEQNLDVRTITLGISLLDCISDDPKRLNDKVYQKITGTAKDLVRVSDEIANMYGIPIINKRITVTDVNP